MFVVSATFVSVVDGLIIMIEYKEELLLYLGFSGGGVQGHVPHIVGKQSQVVLGEGGLARVESSLVPQGVRVHGQQKPGLQIRC